MTGRMAVTNVAWFNQMLNNIANDLDMLLSDLCQIYPYPQPKDSQQNNVNSEQKLLEDYISGAEDETSMDSGTDNRDRNDSILSNHLDVFRLDDADQGLRLPSYPEKTESTVNVAVKTESKLRSISVLERLTKTHPIWFLPDIGRTGAVHLLKDREPGIFIVRRSSQNNTWALSVQFPQGPHANIDHYLIESTASGLRLQGSSHHFPAIPNLVAYYCANLDELPLRLVLPPAILTARTPQDLMSLALLGQDFWTSPLTVHAKSLARLKAYPGKMISTNHGIHKSCSEPISIKKTFETNQSSAARCHNPTPFYSTDNFTTFFNNGAHSHSRDLKNNNDPRIHNLQEECCEKVESRDRPVSLGISESPGMSDFTGQQFESAKKCPFSLGNGTTCKQIPVNDSHRSVEHQQLVGSSKIDTAVKAGQLHAAKSAATQTSMKERKPPLAGDVTALYGTTSLDFLTPPLPGYYSSNLSDRMSDYYDVWKNSIPTPTPERKKSGDRLVEKSADQTMMTNMSPCEQVDVSLENELASMDLHVTGKPPMGPQFNTYKYSEKGYDNGQGNSPTTPTKSIPTAERTTKTMSVASVSLEMPVVASKPPKVKPPPLPAVGRLKSSSNPSLTGFKSPVYSQPFDALCDSPSHVSGSCDDISINSRKTPPRRGVRRQKSLPMRSLRERRRQRTAHIPKLDPIISPAPTAMNQSVELTQDAKILFNDSRLGRLGHPVDESGFVGSQTLQERGSGGKNASKSTFYVTYPIPIRRRAPKTSNSVALKFASNKDTVRHDSSDSAFEDTCFFIEDLESSIHEQAAPMSPSLNKFPVISTEFTRNSLSDSSTVEDLISNTAPDCTVKSLQPLTLKNLQRVSEYDNLMNPYRASSVQTASSMGTVFCKPWDSTPWENLLQSDSPVPVNGSGLLKLPVASSVPEKIEAWQEANKDYERLAVWDEPTVPDTARTTTPTNDDDNTHIEGSTSTLQNGLPQSQCFCRKSNCEQCNEFQNTDALERNQSNNRLVETTEMVPIPLDIHIDIDDDSDDDLPLPMQDGTDNASPSFKEKLKPFLSTPRFLHLKAKNKSSGARVREYIYRISQDHNTIFGSTICNFIQCTKECQERNPQVVMRNVRQFMNGIKNYLVKHGEGELEALIESERGKLEANEILNIDAIIEGALHKCVIHPLKHYIYKLFVEEYSSSGALKHLAENIKYARNKTPAELGIKAGLSPPSGTSLEVVKHFLNKMQKAYSPLKKLENLLGATSSIYHSVQCNGEKGKSKAGLGADDFLPMFIYVLVHCGLVAAEIESEYMWGLLHPSILTGEGGYYLTTLSSAVLVLKNIREMQEPRTAPSGSEKERVPSICGMQGFLKVVILDELQDSLLWKTLPVRPNMNTKDVCAMMAHKFKITNPQDYGLYLLFKGNEKPLIDSDCPQVLRADHATDRDECVFAYKRRAANIAWPKTFK